MLLCIYILSFIWWCPTPFKNVLVIFAVNFNRIDIKISHKNCDDQVEKVSHIFLILLN